MRFTPNLRGYLLLGFAFFLFVGLPFAFLISIISTVSLVGGVLVGGLWGMVVLAIAMMIGGFILMGWLIYRFVKTNRFG
jgi:hypothetical protein